ncbi:unnamed protein product [Eruca vesicaria subsp. sativa]|uniref:Uncharacterized protein n=1 Tax=Eruca vesicaria subsp. sativa TaxID=29727 RepID=A0ABC8J0U4_ERUVS|nr:unnamed protein product [Eruca vesicaria subsp. sativa]
MTRVAMYHDEICVYDDSEKATFVLLGDAGPELTGSQAAELIDNYFEANGDMGANHEMSSPKCLVGTIGQTHKFRVKVSSYNFTVPSHTITVTEVVCPALLPPFGVVAEIQPYAIDETAHAPGVIQF